MWYIHLKNKYGTFIPVTFFDCITPESSGLTRRKELAESLGFVEGEDTHHFIKDNTEIRLMWKRVTFCNIPYLRIREEHNELVCNCEHANDIFELRNLLIND